jgi:type II secretory pathway component HofQ
MFAQARVWFLALLMVWALSHASVFGETGEPVARDPSPAERIKKVLDQPMSLDFTGASLHHVIQHLKEKTRINFVLDMFALQQSGLAAEENNASGSPDRVALKGDRNTKLRTAIQRTLNAYNLTFVILEDSVLITTDEIGLSRQMRQRISVNLTNIPFSTALKDLARGTALNLVIDPRLGREADAKINLQLDDASLETTVRLLAEMANLKSVRMGNVLFVTTEPRADKLRREELPLIVPGGTPSASGF